MKQITLRVRIGVLLLTVACVPLHTSASGSDQFISRFQAEDSNVGSSNKENEALKIAALEGLMNAPSKRTLRLIQNVLDGNSSLNVKRKALFVLGQHEQREAQELLLDYARQPGALQIEAIRMIGVGGQRGSLGQLKTLFKTSSEAVKEAVLQAYLIADDALSVLELAKEATNTEEFDRAVRVLGAMDARDELRELFDRDEYRESLTQAYAIAGDLQSLQRIAREAGTESQRIAAIRSIGIVGTDEAKDSLVALYRAASTEEVRDAVLQGLIISDHDRGVITLFRESQDSKRKQALMRTLVIMDSDLAIDVIDSTLSEGD